VNTDEIMKKLQWMAGCSAIALMASGCATGTKQAKAPKPQSFENPTVQAVAPPEMKPQQMMSAIPVPAVPVVSHRDPFAQVATPTDLKFATVEPVPAPANAAAQPASTTMAIIGPFRSPAKAVEAAKPVKAVAVVPQPMKPVSQPAARPKAIAKVPTKLPIAPVSSPVTPLPALVPAVPVQVPVPTVPSAADAIAVTGVLQVAGKWTAIVQEPNATPRYVQVGDKIAGGRVVLKQITVSPGGNPTVVLVENGQEVIKSLGSPAA
jgi:hypothetical protein